MFWQVVGKQKTERDRNGRGGETQSKYTSWGQWRGEKVPVVWKPQCDEILSWEAPRRGEHTQRKREGSGRKAERESAFTAGHFHLSVWEMDGWNQTPIKASWKSRTCIQWVQKQTGELHPFQPPAPAPSQSSYPRLSLAVPYCFTRFDKTLTEPPQFLMLLVQQHRQFFGPCVFLITVVLTLQNNCHKGL